MKRSKMVSVLTGLAIPMHNALPPKHPHQGINILCGYNTGENSRLSAELTITSYNSFYSLSNRSTLVRQNTNKNKVHFGKNLFKILILQKHGLSSPREHCLLPN